MPRVDFPTIADTNDFAPLPDGEYVCVLTDIEVDRTRVGDEMWKLRWTVQDGEFAGRLLFDNLVFSQRALSRVKLVCCVCGVDTSSAVDLQPDMLLDKRAVVSTFQEEYSDEQGRTKIANRVPFEGYAAAQPEADGTPF